MLVDFLIWQLITVACKLHNICLARFKLDHPHKATPEAASETVQRNRRDSKVGDNEEVREYCRPCIDRIAVRFCGLGVPAENSPYRAVSQTTGTHPRSARPSHHSPKDFCGLCGCVAYTRSVCCSAAGQRRALEGRGAPRHYRHLV